MGLIKSQVRACPWTTGVLLRMGVGAFTEALLAVCGRAVGLLSL